MDYMGESGRAGAGGNVASLGNESPGRGVEVQGIGSSWPGLHVGAGPGASCLQFPHSLEGVLRGTESRNKKSL